MKIIVFIFFSLISEILNAQEVKNTALVGTWKCSTYDITVRTYIEGETVCANLLSFPCSHKIKKPLADHFDIHNPKKELRSRRMLNIMVLSKLVYEGNNKWIDGDVYVPATGQFYNATLILNTPTQLQIRGFIGFEFIGKSLIFNKINK